MNKAYWISPSGQSIEAPTTHIRLILDKPAKFGLKKSDIIKTYEKYGEKRGIEGRARTEIMSDLMRKGWIRVRYIPKQDMWTIQTYFFGNKEKNNTWDWVRYAYKNNIANRYADLRILIIKSGRVISSSFSEASKGKKIFENLFKKDDTMKLIPIVNQLFDNTNYIIQHAEKHKNMIFREAIIVTETSLSRIWQHINNSDSTFAVISAYLDNGNDELNHKQLAKDIRSMGLGFIEMDSGYSYKTVDGEQFASEKSYMIPNITKDKAIKLAKKYEQQSVLWKDGEGFILLGTRSDVGMGKILMKFKTTGNSLTFAKSTVKAAFSALQKGSKNQVGKKFAFVSELRTKDFPTSYIYQNNVLDEWIRVL